MCSCGKGKTSTAPNGWEHVSTTGVVTPKKTEGEARMAVSREGGKARPKS